MSKPPCCEGARRMENLDEVLIGYFCPIHGEASWPAERATASPGPCPAWKDGVHCFVPVYTGSDGVSSLSPAYTGGRGVFSKRCECGAEVKRPAALPPGRER